MTTPTASTTTTTPTESTVTTTTTVTGPTTTVTGHPTTTINGQSTTVVTGTTTVTVQPTNETATTFTTVTPTPTTTTAASTTTVTTTVPSTTTVTTTVPATTTVTATTTVAGPTTTVLGATTTVFGQGTTTYTTNTVSTATATPTATTTVTVTAPTRTVTLDAYTSTVTATSAVTNTVTTVTCFCSGTLIRIERDGMSVDVAVEALQVGDSAVTPSGMRRPIRWIGQRHVRCDTHPSPRKVWPVRVRAGAFGAGLPEADLWLSPGHALCLADTLVPVRGLIDGERVTQVERAEVSYWHVEVEGHDVLLANGMPAESYLDTGNRRFFGEDGVVELHFDEDPEPGWDGTGTCLPLIESGPRLSAIRTLYGLGRAGAGAALGPAPIGVHLVADDTTILPYRAGENEMCFVIPTGTADLRLVSPRFNVDGDLRRLGVILSGLAVSDGSGWREIPLDHPFLYAGFHDLEREGERSWRWTDGDGHLAGTLWAGLAGPVLLRANGQFAGLLRPAADPAVLARRAA